MTVYQQTLSAITPSILENAIFNKRSVSNIQYFYFNGNPNTQTFHDALTTLHSKHKTLSYPDKQSFLCLEIQLRNTADINTASAILNRIADAINTALCHNLLFMTLIYQDDSCIHPVIVISNIEKSPDMSHNFLLTPDTLMDILSTRLPEYDFKSIAYESLFAFDGSETELAYDGVVHISCQLSSEPHLL